MEGRLYLHQTLIDKPEDLWELKDLVRKECQKIKEFFSPKEIEKIFQGEVNGNHFKECIYGKMTGHCNSQRVCDFISSELITLIVTDSDFKKPSVAVDNRTFEQILTPLEYFISTEDTEDWNTDGEFSEVYKKRIDFVLNLLT